MLSRQKVEEPRLLVELFGIFPSLQWNLQLKPRPEN